jgi:tRNA(Ile)-lysidine synthase
MTETRRPEAREPLAQSVARFLAEQELNAAGIVVAVSGGPDSVALLLSLAQVHGDPLVVAHLNHQLRGPESDEDEAFVAGLAERLNLNCRCARFDVAERARVEQENLEATARRVRYDWLADVCRETGISVIATGHTTDDQAETVLHRLLRGSGFKGLSGIARRKTLTDGIELIRPLLSVRRADVLAFLAAAGQEYRLDSSNQDRRYTRNRIRHELLPLLRSDYNQGIDAVLCRLAEQAQRLEEDVRSRATALLASAELPRAGGWVILKRSVLDAAGPTLVRETLRLIWERESWPRGEMSSAAWQRVTAVALGQLPATDLPGSVRGECRESVVRLGPAS